MAKDKKPEKKGKPEKVEEKKAAPAKAKKGADTKAAKSKKSKDDEDDDFAGPSSSNFKIAEYVGQLLLITPKSVEEDVPTSFGEADAVRADVVILDGDSDDVGEEHAEVLIFQRVLQGQLRPAIGKNMVLGRLTTGTAKKGQDAPYLLDDPTDKDKKIARAWLKANRPF